MCVCLCNYLQAGPHGSMPVLRLLSGSKIAPINVKFGPWGPLPLAKVYVYLDTNVQIEPPKSVEILNLTHKIAPQGRLVGTIFTKSQHLYASVGSFYSCNLVAFGGQTCNQVISIFPRWGHFPTNFQ